MKNKKTTVLLTVVTLSLLITACGTGSEDFDREVAVIVALTQTAMANNSAPAPVVTEAAPTTAPAGDYQPISEQECSNLNAILSQQTGIAGVMVSPAPFDDYVNEKTGFGCKITLITTRADESGDGPASLVVVDPDGNPVLLDQHVPRPGAGD